MNKINDKLIFSDKLQARNRIVMPPMDTLMASDGFANEFHIQHYGARAYGGVGTIVVESTAVSEEGKIRDQDLGLWKDEHITEMQKVAKVAKGAGAVIGVQLNHAGAKSQATTIQTYGPTKFYDYLDKDRDFRLMTTQDLDKLKKDFVSAAVRAKKAGFDFVEIHGAHGYLINELLHPKLNDVFGWNNIKERSEFLVEIIDTINKEVQIPVGIRLSITDHDENGIDEHYYKELIELISDKVIYFNISSGETVFKARTDELIKKAGTKIFRIQSAKLVKSWTNRVVFTGGNVETREDALEVVNAGIDGVFIGRELIFNPNVVVNKLLEPEEIDEELYHWNKNIWYSHKQYSSLLKMLKSK